MVPLRSAAWKVNFTAADLSWQEKGSGELKAEAETATDTANFAKVKAEKSQRREDYLDAIQAAKVAVAAWRNAAAKMDDRIKKGEGTDALFSNKRLLQRFAKGYKQNARAMAEAVRELTTKLKSAT